MKKQIAFLLTAVLIVMSMQVFALPTTAYAGTQVDSPDMGTPLTDAQAKVVTETLSKFFGIKDTPKKIDASLYNGNYEVYIDYNDYSISATMTKDNFLTYYASYPNEFPAAGTPYKYPKLTRAECIKIAQDTIAKLYPNLPEGLKIIVDTEPNDTISFSDTFDSNIYTEYNGVETSTNGSININFYTGKVDLLYLDEAVAKSYPSKDGIVSADKATETLKKNVKFTLQYCDEYDKNNNPTGKAVLVYTPVSSFGIFVDAKTGEMFDLLKYGMEQSKDAAANEYELTPTSGDFDKTNPKGTKSLDELSKTVMAVKNIALNSDYKMTWAYYYDSYDDSGSQSCSMTFTSEKANTEMIVTVDAKTGDIIYITSYSLSSKANKDAMKYDRAKAEAIADEFFSTVKPDLYKKMKLQKDDTDTLFGDNSQIAVSYAIEENGVPYTASTSSVYIDANGKVSSFYWNEGLAKTFESKDGIVSADDISAKLGDLGVSLCYFNIAPYLSNVTEPDVRLMYHINSEIAYGLEGYIPQFVAKTGEIYSSYTNSGAIPKYTDIADSKYKEAIEKLADIDVGYFSEKFEPSKSISQRDYLCLTLGTIYDYTSYTGGLLGWVQDDDLKETAVNAGIITADKFSPDKPITRADAIAYLFKAHGADQKTGNVDYVKLAEEKKILPEGFKADDKELTRGEAAYLIYMYMSN